MARLTILLFILAICSMCIIGTFACGPNSVFDECASDCPVTCRNMHDGPTTCRPVCVARCKCLGGTVQNDEGRCVLPSEC